MNPAEEHQTADLELTLTNAKYPWKLVVFAYRESLAMLIRTLNAAQVSAREIIGIDVVINGNTPLALALKNHLDNPDFVHEAVPVRVWDIAVGDKANAWNQYIHQIWAGESIAFFIDGYVQLNPNSIKLLGEAIADKAGVMGGTGVPNDGQVRNPPHTHSTPESGFHGNFCCIKGTALEEMRSRKISLPFGLYRVDSLMGALLTLGLDPVSNVWVGSRIYVHPEASWQTDPKHWWRMSDIRAQIKRILRQSRGMLENLAIRDHLRIRKQQPELMLQNADELILEWVQRCPSQVNKVLRFNPLARRALSDIKQSAGKAKTIGKTTPVLMGFSKTP